MCNGNYLSKKRKLIYKIKDGKLRYIFSEILFVETSTY